ncbi:MAG TPA: hypothetical protein VLM43_00250 [Desulfobacterales bacterium]|nr:hypothetical protein [Desulfobacterales bacterium]
MFPLKPFKFFMPLRVLKLLVGIVKSRINCVPSGKEVSVGMNAPEADKSLVLRSKTFVHSDPMGFSLTGRGNTNLSYGRLFFIGTPFFKKKFLAKLMMGDVSESEA